MIEFYAQIRLVHIVAVFAGGGLFFLRGLGLLMGARWPRYISLRVLGYAVDTVFLTAAMMLMTIVRQYPFIHGWLTVKVLALGIYLAFGWLALRPGLSRRHALALWLAALAVFTYIITVAWTHAPLGVLTGIAV